MKSMKKSLNVGKVFGSIRKRAGGHGNSHDAADDSSPAAGAFGSPSAAAAAAASGSPEENARAAVKAFCEMGGTVSQRKGDEILHLPPIVDAAESSPAAAAECAGVIRRFLGKEYNSKPAWQYNALMLVRILVDNPGPTFTRNLGEAEFVETTRKLLKHVRDTRLRNMLMEMLDDFEHTKQYDENLQPLVQMWQAQKEEAFRKNGGPPPQLMQQRQQAYQQQQYFQHQQQWQPHPSQNRQSQSYAARPQQSAKRLPDSAELSSRLEEARTSAKLLEQVVMNTPPAEMLSNDLIKEFAERCQSASRSIQGYMQSDNPVPDNDTMESLIDTNEQLQTALNQHQRAVLNARKQTGVASPPPQTTTPNSNGHDRILAWQQSQVELHESGEHPEDPHSVNGKGKATAAGPDEGHHDGHHDGRDPFRDPDEQQRHQFEPYHPGGFGQADGPSSAGAAAGGASSTQRRDVDGVSDDDLYDAPSAAAKAGEKQTEPARVS